MPYRLQLSAAVGVMIEMMIARKLASGVQSCVL